MDCGQTPPGPKAKRATANSDGQPSPEDKIPPANSSFRTFTGSFERDSDENSYLSESSEAASPTNIVKANRAYLDVTDDERSKLLAAALAAKIPWDDSLSDDSDYGDYGKPMAKLNSMSTIVNSRSVNTKVLPDAEESEDEVSSFVLSDESTSGSSGENDDMADEVDDHRSRKTRIVSKKSDRRTSRNPACEGKVHHDGFDGRESSDFSDEERKKVNNMEGDSTGTKPSFPGISTTFKWSNVKTKIFYSFRALKGSSFDGSRTISVKNLAKEVTNETIHDFFRDSGSILDIRITRDAHGGRGRVSAYVEFESATAARKAVQKSGKTLQGRVVACDIAYESSSREMHSNPSSAHGEKQPRTLSRTNSAPIGKGLDKPLAALNLFDPKFQGGDAKFLNCFDPYRGINPPPPGYPEVAELSKELQTVRGREMATVREPPHQSYGGSFSVASKTQDDLDQSDYFDAQNLDAQNTEKQKPNGWRKKWPWRWWRTKGKWTKHFWAWRKPRWQWWHFAKISTKWVRRKDGSRLKVDSGKKIVASPSTDV